MAEQIRPKSRHDLARMLKGNGNCIPTTITQLDQQFDLDVDKKKSLELLLHRIQDAFRKSKKSLASLEGEWWHSALTLDFDAKMKSSHHRKNLIDLTLQQQRVRISSVLESIKLLSTIEDTSEIQIAALALQLLSNQADNRGVAQISKSVVHDEFPGKFGKTLRKELDLNKALFLLDLLQVGKRKYTQLRQNLLSSEIHFPSYRKVAEHRNSIILRHLIQPYPTVVNPIGMHVPYAQYVRHTFLRIMSTLPLPSTQDFPLQFQIADGLDGSGSHTVYNQTITNTETKSFILFCFRPIQITSCSGSILWKNLNPNSPFTQRPIFLHGFKQFMNDQLRGQNLHVKVEVTLLDV